MANVFMPDNRQPVPPALGNSGESGANGTAPVTIRDAAGNCAPCVSPLAVGGQGGICNPTGGGGGGGGGGGTTGTTGGFPGGTGTTIGGGFGPISKSPVPGAHHHGGIAVGPIGSMGGVELSASIGPITGPSWPGAPLTAGGAGGGGCGCGAVRTGDWRRTWWLHVGRRLAGSEAQIARRSWLPRF